MSSAIHVVTQVQQATLQEAEQLKRIMNISQTNTARTETQSESDSKPPDSAQRKCAHLRKNALLQEGQKTSRSWAWQLFTNKVEKSTFMIPGTFSCYPESRTTNGTFDRWLYGGRQDSGWALDERHGTAPAELEFMDWSVSHESQTGYWQLWATEPGSVQ